MGRILCTFSGKIGDILWSLPTVRQISRNHGTRVDFACMHEYQRLIPLISEQEYIASAYTMPDWICQGSPFGDQPWKAPVRYDSMYSNVYHLTYRRHPSIYEKLPLHIADSVGIVLTEAVQPWLKVHRNPALLKPAVSYGFNEMYSEMKNAFIQDVRIGAEHLVAFHDVSKLTFYEAAQIIAGSDIFIGCRSSLHVLAHALGTRVMIYEPEAARNWDCFKSPWGQEVQVQNSTEAIRVLGSAIASKGASA